MRLKFLKDYNPIPYSIPLNIHGPRALLMKLPLFATTRPFDFAIFPNKNFKICEDH